MIHVKPGVGEVHIKDNFWGKYPYAAFIRHRRTIAWLSSAKYKRVTRRFASLEKLIDAIDKSKKSDYVPMR